MPGRTLAQGGLQTVYVRFALAAAAVVAAVPLIAGQQPRRVDDAALRKAGQRRRVAHLRPRPVGDALQPAHRHQRVERRAARPGVGVRARARAAAARKPRRWCGTTRSTASPTGAWCSRWTRRTGKEKWRWDPWVNKTEVRPEICCGVVNRGLALYQGMVYVPVIDGRLQALDAMTGKVVWESRVAFPQDHYTLTMAPRIAKGKVIIGASGGDRPTRGFFDAYDALTGRRAWRFYTVPGDPVEAARERRDEEGDGHLGQGVVEERRRRRGVGRRGLRPGAESRLRRHRQRRAVAAGSCARRWGSTISTSARSSRWTSTPVS